VKVALVTVTGFITIVFRRIFAACLRHYVTSLAYTSSRVISIFTLAAGVTEINGTGHPAVFYVTTDQVYVRTLGVGRIFRIIFNVRSMTVITLNILIFAIVTFFVRMAVCTNVQFIRRTGRDLCAAPVST
jgi:hypothetical protein